MNDKFYNLENMLATFVTKTQFQSDLKLKSD